MQPCQVLEKLGCTVATEKAGALGQEKINNLLAMSSNLDGAFRALYIYINL